MKPIPLMAALFLGAAAAPSAVAGALSVELWTDRGANAVYQPGEAMRIATRASDDAYVLVYEIDAEGRVHTLFPRGQASGFVEGGRKLRLPGRDSEVELVVQGPVGLGYIVAIASIEPFLELPWYLRPHDARAEQIGYHGRPDDEGGVTSDGRIVGDPFVAMERIRRAVVGEAEDPRSFATAYTTYYVHHEVRYPRYLCNDCHRPNRWAWWDGFDPYYARCDVFDVRVNWSWSWGPRYWYGFVPYYVYVYRNDCPPRYRRHYASGLWHSSWDGWRRWRTTWGSLLTRYKSAPPPGYLPPTKDDERRRWRERPPGFLADGPGSDRPRVPRARPLGWGEPRIADAGRVPGGRWGDGAGTGVRPPRVARDPRDPGGDREPRPAGRWTRPDPPRAERPWSPPRPGRDGPPAAIRNPRPEPVAPPRVERPTPRQDEGWAGGRGRVERAPRPEPARQWERPSRTGGERPRRSEKPGD